MNKKIRIAGIAAALAFSAIILLSPSQPPPLPSPTPETKNESIKTLAEGLKRPWAIAFADDRILVTEKDGNIRVIESGKLLDEPLASLRVAKIFGGGLLGIAPHPDFEKNHFLYVYFTYEEQGDFWNKVVRLTVSDNSISDAVTILDKIPGSQFYNGGALKFGPDKKLYVATGLTSENSGESQDISSLGGKILRLNDDGTIPSDNPFVDSPVFSLGHRDIQGMAWDKNGNLYATEMGPTKNDEINLVKAGQNYGWPGVECGGNEKYADSIMCYDPSIEPGGIVFYTGDKLQYEDNMIMATMRGTSLYKLVIDKNGVESQKNILSGVGRIRDVNEGPDGNLYIITSNTDGKGFASKTDDKLIEILR
ncbi:MAG TPA: PQQ-dependent sugar dehydrogenase [Candidatus Nitrosotenuis sp.]|nr:PQQ-dependent sugar dehydrogenase [Candidatus Nitrosotenuis sp.]